MTIDDAVVGDINHLLGRNMFGICLLDVATGAMALLGKGIGDLLERSATL